MSTTYELEQLLVDLVGVWPDDRESPVVQAARDYLSLHCGISVNGNGTDDQTITYYDLQGDALTESWYAV